jgi:predicted ATPase
VQLPRPATPFLGRERELQEVLELLLDEDLRLLTLTGPGGTGKTRLGVRAGEEAAPAFPDGVFWVGLSSLRDPALVPETISQTLEAKQELAKHIADRRLLLLLDNLEQVIEAAPELASLLQACPNLTLLVTSRELLRVSGEIEYPVPPLVEAEAVSLFCARSQLEPSEEIAELCARVDNLPLAVELAAARTKALSPGQILERLSGRLDLLRGGRDADPRQQTLRATIEWSYDLLSPEEQALFRRLSVFAGGCTLEAAEEVCDAELDTLQSLVEKSLLRFTNERYWMLGTIRGFGEERQGDTSDGADVRDAHAAFFGAWCARTREELYRGDDAAAVHAYEDEQHNVRAAVTRLHETDRSERLLELVAHAIDFWEFRGEWAEGRRWADVALEHGVEPGARARVLMMVGAFARHARDWDASRAYQLESLSIYRDLNDFDATVPVLNGLSNVAAELGEYEEAEGYLEEAIRVAQTASSERMIAMCTGNLADLALRQGHDGRAMELASVAVSHYRRLGWGPGLAWCLYLDALCHLRVGQVSESVRSTREALLLGGGPETLAWLFVLSGATAARLGRPESGAVLLGLADALTARLDLSLTGAEVRLLGDSTSVLRAALGDSRFATAEMQGRAMSSEDGVAFALASLD